MGESYLRNRAALHAGVCLAAEAIRIPAEAERHPSTLGKSVSYRTVADPEADEWAAVVLLFDADGLGIGAYLVAVHGALRATADGQVLARVIVSGLNSGLQGLPRYAGECGELSRADLDALTNAVRADLGQKPLGGWRVVQLNPKGGEA